MMTQIYTALSVATALAWASLLLYCLPGTHRVVFGRPRKYDLLSTLFCALVFSRLGYRITRFSFWGDDYYKPTELAVRIVLELFALLCVVMVFAVLRHYRRQEDVFG